VSSSDWPKQSKSLTCGSRSTVNIDRATTGLGWAGTDMGRVGPVWAGPARTRFVSWLCHVVLRFQKVCGSMRSAHGEQTGSVHGFCTRSTVEPVHPHLFPLGSWCTECIQQLLCSVFPLLPLLGRALTGGERWCLRAGGSKAEIESSNTPRGLKELNRGVNGAD
jgi:hypothetical protein